MRNYRSSWQYNVTEAVAGNYAPVNAFMFTKDVITGNQLSIVVDRSQGGASMADGELEIMVQRRLQHDDGRGVGEPLNETGLTAAGTGLIIRGTHSVHLDPAATAAANRRTSVANLLWRPFPNFAPLTVTPAAWVAANKASYSGVTAPLPANVHLLTAHSIATDTLILRLSHSYEVGEDAVNSQPATVSLANMFAPITLTSCVEMTMTANQPLTAVPQTTYMLDGGQNVTLPIIPTPPAGADMSITLGPMDIRTFKCVTAPAA